MSYRVVYDPEVHSDIQDVVDYYNSKREKLGELFYELVKAELVSLETRALHYQIRYDNVRQVLIPRFPYAAHYRVLEEQKVVIIEAVLGTSGDPNKFRTKL